MSTRSRNVLRQAAATALLAVLFLTAGNLSAAEKVMYNFDKGTNGWWKYASPESKIELSADTSGAEGSAGSLKIVYQYGGQSAYLGAGVEPKYALGGNPSVAAYAGGHLHIAFKSSGTAGLKIELRCKEKGTYAYTIPALTTEWQSFDIPFDSFKSKDKNFSAADTPLLQMVVIPAKTGDQSTTLWMDEVKFSSEPAPAK